MNLYPLNRMALALPASSLIPQNWMSIVRQLLLVGAGALLSIGSAQGQGTPSTPEVAVVTRMCLWNADKAMWSRLGLRKDQIRRMQAIRARYPAVIEGQWIREDTVQAAGPGNRGAAYDPASSKTAGAAPAPQGMQAEVRAVLTPRQVNKWMALCTGVAERKLRERSAVYRRRRMAWVFPIPFARESGACRQAVLPGLRPCALDTAARFSTHNSAASAVL